MKAAVITDVHANLPALRAALVCILAEGCDAIFHTGDAIAIGPFPGECLDLLLSTPKTHFVMGNHDAYFAEGVPTPQPAWMSDGEVQHQRWTHSRLDGRARSALAQWPYLVRTDMNGVKAAFLHYGLTPSGSDFVPVAREPSGATMDGMFAPLDAELIFFGHDHRQLDVTGRGRYVNPGSLGCHREAVARYCLACFSAGRYSIERRAVPYDDEPLRRAFDERAVPERHFIYRAFFGDRFSTGRHR